MNGRKVHRVAEPGEHVPRDNQFLVPDPRKKGRTWKHFVHSLERLGYVVEWKKIIAADYSAPTIRKRLFMVARCDGQEIVWPEATHAKNLNVVKKNGVKQLSALILVIWAILFLIVQNLLLMRL